MSPAIEQARTHLTRGFTGGVRLSAACINTSITTTTTTTTGRGWEFVRS